MCLIFCLSSCLGTRHLQDDEYLLRKQKIKGGRHLDKEELELFFKQEPNKKIPLIPFNPYVWIYHQGKNLYNPEKIEKKIEKIELKFENKIIRAKSKGKSDRVERLEERKQKKISKKQQTLKEGNLLMRWGEPLTVYDESLTKQTNDQLDLYMKTQGYFNSKATYTVNRKKKQAFVTYQLKEGQPHLIDTFHINTSNRNIQTIIQSQWKKRLIKEGDQYNQDMIVRERNRIERLLQNNGYFDFNKRYINFKIDTINKNYEAGIELVIIPHQRGFHKVFTVDSVNFITDAGEQGAGKRQSTLYNKINYLYFEDNYSKKILDQRTFIYPGNVYSRRQTLSTQTQLANLDNFKFVNVNYDTTGGRFISNIFTSALPKYQMTNELGMNVTQGIPGPFYQFSIKDRNVFKGLENMELSGYFGFEGVASVTAEDDVYSSIETGAKFSIYFPQFLFPGFSQLKMNSGRLNPNTVLQTGFDFTSRPEYDRTGFNASLRYNWRNYDKKVNHNLTLIDVGLINSDLDKSAESRAFANYLDSLKTQGNNLVSSFEPSFVTSMQYLVTYNFNPPNDQDRKASYLKLFAESGGALYNIYTPQIVKDSTLEFYQFLKGNIEYIRHVPLSEFGVLASRIKIGAAYSYGAKGTLPYEKYLFSGGSNSIRAWRPRRLGPGSFNHNNDSSDYSYSNKIEQPGELLIEANLEYRDKLIGFVDWAFFVDVGNTWLINKDPSRPSGRFKFNEFYKEFGVGSGMGVRLNFSFLIVRLDYAVKIYDPLRMPDDRFVNDEFDKGLWNLAIGYPF